MTQAIVFFIEDATQADKGSYLAEKFHFAIVSNPQDYRFVLVLTKRHLELRVNGEKIKPIFIDFFAPQIQVRLQKSSRRSELIARAVGIKKGHRPSIIDVTAGLANDAIVLAHLGCEVTLVERSPILCALLDDALSRVKGRMPALPDLYYQDSKLFLADCIQQAQQADVLYLDPMFPDRTKTALVKKEMRLLKQLVGSDCDAIELFELARLCAKKRVVVKRPKLAPPLTTRPPDLVYQAKSCRFDVYLV